MRDHSGVSHKNLGECPGVLSNGTKSGQKCVFFCHQDNITFWPLIQHRFRVFFETVDVSHCPSAYTSEKIKFFAWGCFASSQNEKNGVISRECLLSVCSSNSTILDDRIHFTSQRCTFCMWVLVRNVQFGHLFPRKTQFLCWMQMVHPFTVHQR